MTLQAPSPVVDELIPLKFSVTPLTGNCERVFQRADHLVIGVSPGNRYFSVPLLTGLLRWACQLFQRVDAIVPDSTLVHNFLSLGYPEDRAAKKARTEIQAVRNRIARAWAVSGTPVARHRTHMLSELTSNTTYRTLRAAAEVALRNDERFREASLQTIHTFLQKRLNDAEPTPAQIEHAEQYLIAELPFMLDSATIFQVPSSLNFYHRTIPLARLLYLSDSSLRASRRQGYAVIHPTPEADLAGRLSGSPISTGQPGPARLDEGGP